MDKVRCEMFGVCPLADGEVHEVDSLAGHTCPVRDEVSSCGIVAASGGAARSTRGAPRIPKAVVFAVLGLLAVCALGGVGYGVYRWLFATPGCDIAQARSLLTLDPKVGELEQTGSDCFAAGQANGDSEQLVMATQLLRIAADKGSTKAALLLGRLFDPLARAELEKDAKVPQLLPMPDPVIAYGYYAKAAAVEPDAKTAMSRLQARYKTLGAEVSNRDGLPLSMPGHDSIYQRVLAKPGAMLVDGPGASGGTPLETFGLLYVFAVKPGWRQVGHLIETGPEGWVAEGQVQPWNVMLVMRYAPQGARSPVLFFKEETAAKGLLLEPDPAASVAALVKSAETQADPRLAAIEEKFVDWRTMPYVMPVLRSSPVVANDGQTIYLAEVGSVAGQGRPAASAAAPSLAAPVAGRPGYCADASQAASVHQVVFVIDTTSSMGPYIQGVRRIAQTWRDEIERRGLTDKFRFGVIAYRNNMDAPAQQGLEYVTRNALPLSRESDARRLAAAMDGLAPATVSTHSFDEDAVAGLKEAVDFDWSQGCGGRFLFLITDAGALKSDDPKARNPGVGLTTIAARAREQGISIFPVHVETAEARRAANIERAAEQYRAELDTSEAGNGADYRTIANGSPAAFNDYLRQVGSIITAIGAERQGALQAKPVVAPPAGGGTAPTVSVKDMVLGKLFSVQQRFLGALAHTPAPTFTSSWTSDRDLANLSLPALEVSVYLTRRQLNMLAEKTKYLIDSARLAKTESSAFFNALQMVSAATSQDPSRLSGPDSSLKALMPSFLAVLPYKSPVLALTPEQWRAMGAANQNAFIRRLQEKLAFYRSLDADQSLWKNLGSNDPAQAIALVPLNRLP